RAARRLAEGRRHARAPHHEPARGRLAARQHAAAVADADGGRTATGARAVARHRRRSHHAARGAAAARRAEEARLEAHREVLAGLDGHLLARDRLGHADRDLAGRRVEEARVAGFGPVARHAGLGLVADADLE